MQPSPSQRHATPATAGDPRAGAGPSLPAGGPGAPAGAQFGDYRGLARTHYENFPVGSLLLPRAARRDLRRIYAFARTADDLADEARSAQALAAFRADFLAHVAGERADVPLLRDLAATIRERALELSLFTDLLDAFAQDLVVSRYADFDALRGYCRLSANPVGRLVLRVCGFRDERLDLLSDRICTALQLLNHLQDVGSDLRERDRIYWPRDERNHFGVAEHHLGAAHAGPELRSFVLHQADRLAAEFAAGWPLCDAVRGRLRWELRAILRSAARVLARIRAAGGDVLGANVKLGAADRLRAVAGALLSRRPPRAFAPAAGVAAFAANGPSPEATR